MTHTLAWWFASNRGHRWAAKRASRMRGRLTLGSTTKRLGWVRKEDRSASRSFTRWGRA